MPLSLGKIYTTSYDVTEKAKLRDQMVCLYLPMKLSMELEEFYKDMDGEPVQAGDMHITIGLVRTEDSELNKKALAHAAKHLKPFNVDLEKMDFFPAHQENGNKIVLYAKPVSSHLANVHSVVFDAFNRMGAKIDNGSHEFTPHITVKYCNVEPKKIPIKGGSFKVGSIAYVNGGERHTFSFDRGLHL